MGAAIETQPVGPGELAELANLFDAQRATRRCWCMAFCATRGQFATGWFGGGNARRFAAMANAAATPMGILASVAGEPVGWCACGPRSRYAAALRTPNSIMRDRDAAEDETVWLVPCLFVRGDHRAQGVTYALVRAAVELARREGADAIEGWPRAGSDRHDAEAFLGREKMFAELGFLGVATPNPERVIMRLELDRE